MVNAQADDAPIEHVDSAMLEQLGEVSAAVRVEEAKRLGDKLQQLTARGVNVELVNRGGSPGEVVAEVAKDLAAELIVIGTHGHTGLQRFLLGSVATAVLRHAPCDVLVCRGTSGPSPFLRPIVATDFSASAARSRACSLGTERSTPATIVVSPTASFRRAH